MKNFILTILFLGLFIPTYAQIDNKKEEDTSQLKLEELPAVVIKNAGDAFSVYIPDNHPDEDVKALEKKFIAYSIGKDYEQYENYLLILQSDTGTLAAKYNIKGKLLGVVENYKGIVLPNEVIYSIYKNYPGWKIVKDKYLYSQSEGDILKKQYHLTITKDSQTRKLIVHPNGEIVKDR